MGSGSARTGNADRTRISSNERKRFIRTAPVLFNIAVTGDQYRHVVIDTGNIRVNPVIFSFLPMELGLFRTFNNHRLGLSILTGVNHDPQRFLIDDILDSSHDHIDLMLVSTDLDVVEQFGITFRRE